MTPPWQLDAGPKIELFYQVHRGRVVTGDSSRGFLAVSNRVRMKFATLYKVCILFRRRRMRAFYDLFRPSPSTRLIDIGGSPYIWVEASRDEVTFPVTLVNIQLYFQPPDERFTSVQGDALDLPFDDASFDIGFSNSVIEHMTTWERQQIFAAEIRRVAKRLWVQTPARSFPMEAHMFSPFFQYLPLSLQRRTARWLTLRGLLTRPSQTEIDEILSDIRLLTYREMQRLFPDCTIKRERFLGMTKSYIAIRMGQGLGIRKSHRGRVRHI